jgi:SagB-type dehydrogenase family enzyme
MPEIIRLPAPVHTQVLSLETVLHARRSSRSFAPNLLPLSALANILWAGYGITSIDGRRTIPSAGGLYPLYLHAACANVSNVPAGIYRYQPNGHRLVRTAGGNRLVDIGWAAMGQDWMSSAAAIVVVAADPSITTAKYGDRGLQFVAFEAGAAAQNICLQAAALSLGVAVVGAFDDDQIASIYEVTGQQQPIALLPLGISSEP